MFKAVVAAGVLYVSALVFAAGYGAIRFGAFYEPPAFTTFAAAAGVDENTLLAAYDEALAGEFGRYKAFTFGAGLVIAVLLGLASALFGVWQHSTLRGLALFAAGAVLTIAVVSILPTMWFPLDRYPIGFVWLLSGMPAALVTWMVAAIVGRLTPDRTPAGAA